MNDTQKQVKQKAKAARNKISQCLRSRGLKMFTGAIVKALMDAKNLPECVEELAACLFVQDVEARALRR